MTRIAMLFNFDQLGGAEKSFCKLINKIDQKNLTVVIPTFKRDEGISSELSKELNIIKLNYPESLYRGKMITSLFSDLTGFFGFIKQIKMLIQENDILWVNGTRIAFPVAAIMIFLTKKKIIWHCRDYPRKSKLYLMLMNFFLSKHNIHFVTNSESVAIAFKNQLGNIKCDTLYNEVEPFHNTPKSIVKKVGVVANLVPWKGVDQILWMTRLYRNELLALGIEEFSIYGDFNYKIGSDEYKKYLLQFEDDFIKFKGLKSTAEIFSSIDILIHPSLRPEPFGRVIVEGYQAKIPVISTCLGGAAEITNTNSCLKINTFDYRGIYLAIEKLLHQNCYEKISDGGVKMFIDISEKTTHQYKKLDKILRV